MARRADDFGLTRREASFLRVRHYRLPTPAREKALGPVDRRMFEAGLVGRAN